MLNFGLGAVPQRSKIYSTQCSWAVSFNWNSFVPCRCSLIQRKNISRRAFLRLLQMLKPKSFRGRCPLDRRRGSAPGPHAVTRSARFAFMDSKLLALTRRTKTKFLPTGLHYPNLSDLLSSEDSIDDGLSHFTFHNVTNTVFSTGLFTCRMWDTNSRVDL